MLTTAIFAPQEKSPKVVASPDFTPFAETRGKSQLSANWLLVPAGILALIVLVPAARDSSSAALAPRLARLPGSLD